MIESVAVRQRGAFDFDTHYNDLCALQNSCPLPAVKAHLGEGVIDINGDRIRATDWVPVLNTLRINQTLNFVAVRSYYQQSLQDLEKKKYGSIRKKAPAIRSKEITYRLCKGLKECLTGASSLSCIELQGLPLRDRDLSALAKGMSKNASLQHVSLEYSPVGDEGLETICKGVKNSASVTSLNLTGCNLTWKSGEILAKVIKHQAMKRHNEAWQDSLRYRRPDLDRMSGIRRITVNMNPLLGDQGAAAFAEALKDDLWLKALDLQQCGISSSGAKTLLDVLKYNTTIVVLDVRQNPMIEQDVIRSIMEQVMINCNGQDTEYKWIKAEAPQDPSKAKPKKKRTKTLQSSFIKKTTIKATDRLGRRRWRSTGCVARSLQPMIAEEMEKAPGVPWRTAMRAGRYRGYPPEHTPGKASLYEQMSGDSSSSHHGETSIHIDYNEDISDNDDTETNQFSESEMDPSNLKQIKVELEQMRRRFNEESKARSKAEERVLELTLKNRHLQHEITHLKASGGSLLDDDKVLESIEASFQQFHAFLDLLRDAGLGQLITLAGLDQSIMPFGRPSLEMQPKGSSKRSQPSTSGPARIDIMHPVMGYSHPGLHALDESERNALLHNITAETSAANLSHLLIPNFLPQNYQDSKDPTMQNSTLEISAQSFSQSKFDDLYQKVLKETEGILSHRHDQDISLEKKFSAGISLNESSDPHISRKAVSSPVNGEYNSSKSSHLGSKKQHLAAKSKDTPDDLSDHSHHSHVSQSSKHSRSAASQKNDIQDNPSDHSHHSHVSQSSRHSRSSAASQPPKSAASNHSNPNQPQPLPKKKKVPTATLR